MSARLRWLDAAQPSTYEAVHRVVAAVMEQGGAVGWLGVPSFAETVDWLDGILAAVAAGQARFAAVEQAGRIEAVGRWVRYEKPTVAANAEVQQVMVHPATRGGGLARLLVAALVDDARAAGIEVLTLDVRGNNHAAMALYESLGFMVCGRYPDFVGVGADRWDRVLYCHDLRTPSSTVRRHGGRPFGAGASRAR
jgi:ribosomal protein S18 acetylase RimI-like enzyme